MNQKCEVQIWNLSENQFYWNLIVLYWIKIWLLGGCDSTLEAAETTDLLKTIQQKPKTNFDYDILVMGHLSINDVTIL